MQNTQVTLDCPVCGAMHAGLVATPARDPHWPYRIECPATCIQIPARFDSRGEVAIQRESISANGKAEARDGRRMAMSTPRSR